MYTNVHIFKDVLESNNCHLFPNDFVLDAEGGGISSQDPPPLRRIPNATLLYSVAIAVVSDMEIIFSSKHVKW